MERGSALPKVTSHLNPGGLLLQTISSSSHSMTHKEGASPFSKTTACGEKELGFIGNGIGSFNIIILH